MSDKEKLLSMLKTDSDLTAEERQTMFALVARATGVTIPAEVDNGSSQPGESQWKWLIRFHDHIAPLVGLGNTLIQTEPLHKQAWRDQWPRADAAKTEAKRIERERHQAEKAERAKDADSQTVKA